jgi:hypothetical protein
MSLTKVEYLTRLAHLAAGLKDRQPSNEDLDAFRELIMSRPNDLRRRLLGANVERRRQLDEVQRRALDSLDVAPDLLGPLGELRYEPAHSNLIARFLSTPLEPMLAPLLLQSFLRLVGCSEMVLDLNQALPKSQAGRGGRNADLRSRGGDSEARTT